MIHPLGTTNVCSSFQSINLIFVDTFQSGNHWWTALWNAQTLSTKQIQFSQLLYNNVKVLKGELFL